MQGLLVMGLLVTGFLSTGLWAGVAAAESDRPLRTWTDRSGQHTVEARLVDVRGDRVVLSKTDGSEISVGIAQLSAGDQRTVRLEMRRRSARRGSARRGGTESGIVTERHRSGMARHTLPAAAEPAAGGTVRLVGLDWHRGPEAAVAAAQSQPSGGRPGTERPILWFRVLGDMQGFM